MPPDDPTKPAALEVVRKPDGRFVPGTKSANPKGRPRTGLALAEMIREVAGEPAALREMVQLALDVAHGKPVMLDREWLQAAKAAREAGLPDPPRKGESIQPSLADIARAWDFLATWGFRKPPQEVEITASNGETIQADYAKLSESELDELEAGHARLRALHAKAAGILDVGGG